MTKKEGPWANDVRVESWDELLDELFSGSLVPDDSLVGGHLRAGFVFRGMANAGWDLRTSLERLGAKPEAVESHALRAFSKYARTGSVWLLPSTTACRRASWTGPCPR